MVKKMRKKKSRHPEVPPFEDLLRGGEAGLYGQVCWSIANQGIEPLGPGEVITLEGANIEGGQASRAFRLTSKSVENIERCLGMRTCAEAVDLFVQRGKGQSSEIPTGECPNGHQEEAFAYMMYGIEPTEPCPDCGEIPTFGSMAMSPDLYPDGPVKGVDGQEYGFCPECGEDALEIRGDGVGRWGWSIACLNCEWEMKLAESLDIAQYCGLMEEVKSRIEAINQLMEMPGITIQTRVESICLQLRMLLELIVFSSLVSNKDVWQRSQKELQSSQDISKKMRELKRLHPDFYPIPIDLDGNTLGVEPDRRSEGFLSEDRLIEVYGRLGNILHAENPLGKETDYRFFIDSAPGWVTEVMNLLECHKVYLYHRPEEFYLIKMSGDVDGELMPIRFRTTPEGRAKCAWPGCVASSARQYCEYIQRLWRECGLPELEPEQTEGKRMAEVIDVARPLTPNTDGC